jgi:hypothetical protein
MTHVLRRCPIGGSHNTGTGLEWQAPTAIARWMESGAVYADSATAGSDFLSVPSDSCPDPLVHASTIDSLHPVGLCGGGDSCPDRRELEHPGVTGGTSEAAACWDTGLRSASTRVY